MSGQSTTIKSVFMKVIKNVTRFLVLSIGVILCGHAASSLAATVNVSVVNFAFQPQMTTINAGDSVLWTWPAGSTSHNVFYTGSAMGWPGNSAILSGPATFMQTFNAAGDFPYKCTVHGFTGTITVNAANVPPMVSITNPTSGTVFSAPASLTLKASATDSDGSVTNVKFLNGTTLLGNVAAAPFSITVNNLAAADYTFSAIASDNDGATATNSITVSVINPSPLSISAPAISAQNHFQFSYASDIGLTYVVQVSTSLLSGWTPIATNTATANPTIFTDPNVNNGGSFYRVERLPNP